VDEKSSQSNGDLAAIQHAARDGFDADCIDCARPVIPSWGSNEQCATDAALPRDDKVLTIDIEHCCDQPSRRY